MTALATLTLGSTASTVTFSSIVGTYRDLRLVMQLAGSGTEGLRLRVNGDTASNYNYAFLIGDGSTASSASGSLNAFAGAVAYASTTFAIYDFLDYSVTDKHKTLLSRGNNAAVQTIATAQRWANTAAITSIAVFPTAGTFAAGSTFTLYGVSA
jgi:hypothetical protein